MIDNRRNLIGLGIAVWALTSYVALDLVVKLTAGHLNPWQMALARSVMGLVIAGVAGRWFGMNILGRRRGVMIASGAALVGCILTLTYSLHTLSLAKALLLLYTFPAISALLSPWLAKEKVPLGDWPFIGAAFAGTAFILWPEEGGSWFNIGHLLGFASGFTYALTITLVRGAATENNALTPYFYFGLVGLISLPVPMLMLDDPFFPTTAWGWLGLLLAAGLAASAQISVNKAVQYLAAPKVGVILMGELVMASMIGALFLSEPFTFRLIVGSVLIISAALVLNLKPSLVKSGSARRR